MSDAFNVPSRQSEASDALSISIYSAAEHPEPHCGQIGLGLDMKIINNGVLAINISKLLKDFGPVFFDTTEKQMRIVALALIMSSLASGSAVAEIRIQLQARVATSCGLVNIASPVAGDASRLQLTTVCNSEQFNIVLMGPDGPIEVVSASSSQASVSAGANQMAVLLRAPGAQTFDVQLAEELADVGGLSVQIVAVG